MAAAWPRRPRLRAWIADDVLRRPVLGAAMGEEWMRRLRGGFLRDERGATEQALAAAGLAALEDALAAAPELGLHRRERGAAAERAAQDLGAERAHALRAVQGAGARRPGLTLDAERL